VGIEPISSAAVAGYVAAACSVIVALGSLIKANNPGDAKTAAMVDGATGLMNGYLAANGYDVVGNAQTNGQKPVAVWWHYMTAHALIHAGAVWLVTGNVWFALAEFVLHWAIDFAKCENWTNPHADQALHVACKVAYMLLS